LPLHEYIAYLYNAILAVTEYLHGEQQKTAGG